MSKCFNVKMNRGMTLIEVLTVIAIMLILMAAAVFIDPSPSVELDNAARQLAADLRRAQNMAMAAVEQGGAVPCGYGVYVDSNASYILFYNLTTDCSFYKYDGVGPPALVSEGDCNSNSCLLEIIPIENSVTIAPSGASSDIYFTTPIGITFIDGVNSGSQSFTFTKDGATKTVTVTSAGKIEIQ